MKLFFRTSITASILKDMYKGCSYLEDRLIFVWKNSQIYKVVKLLWTKVKIYFKYSFLGMTSESSDVNSTIIENSRLAQQLISFCKQCKYKVIYFSKTSLIKQWSKNMKAELHVSTIKKVSLIVIVVILVNAILLVFLQKPINLFSFLIRILLLFVATAGVSCEAEWPMVARESVFLNKMELD